tara:strand:+ start:4113 stop:4370 length:258 start_codon:yes stop_codon:yes gene_type:complete
MNKKETQILLTRIEKWYARLQTQFVSDSQILSAEFGWSKEPTSFSQRESLDYNPLKKVTPGDKNGKVHGSISQALSRKNGEKNPL